MKNNTPPGSESVNPLILKLILIGGGILIMVMLIFTTCSIVHIFHFSSSSPDAMQTNTTTVATQPQLHLKTPPSSGSGSSDTMAPLLSQPATFAVEVEIMRQREKARTETIEALKREAQEQAGTSGVPKEALQKLEQSDPIIY